MCRRFLLPSSRWRAKALGGSGLDYAGVDVVVDSQTGRTYCLEANAAPGMSEQTLRSLYAHLQRTVRGRLARAS